MQDADGNTISVGYEGMLMFKVTNILTDGTIKWLGGLNNTQTLSTGDGSNIHKGQGNWPGIPGS